LQKYRRVHTRVYFRLNVASRKYNRKSMERARARAHCRVNVYTSANRFIRETVNVTLTRYGNTSRISSCRPSERFPRKICQMRLESPLARSLACSLACSLRDVSKDFLLILRPKRLPSLDYDNVALLQVAVRSLRPIVIGDTSDPTKTIMPFALTDTIGIRAVNTNVYARMVDTRPPALGPDKQLITN